MTPEETRSDLLVSRRLAEQVAVAEAHLRREMDARGMSTASGWKIVQMVRHSDDHGVEVVLRPLHLLHPSPPDMECVVRIDHAYVEPADCSPPIAASF